MVSDQAGDIGAEWLSSATKEELYIVLANYRYFVHRFMQWMGFTFAKGDSEVLRQLLLANLVDECGDLNGAPSHFHLLQECLASCGLEDVECSNLAPSTMAVEEWFFSSFRDQPLHTCLCILGPGTESVSSLFLAPLEAGMRQAFSDRSVDYTYFDVHRPEVEDAHAKALERAISIVEEPSSPFEATRLARSRLFWTNEAISQHMLLWLGLKEFVRQ